MPLRPRYLLHSIAYTCLTVAAASALSSCKTPASKTADASSGSGSAKTVAGACDGANASSSWCATYTQRDAALTTYLTQHHDDVVSFAGAALGNTGFPFVFLKLIPDLFPAAATAAGPNFAHLGISANIFDTSSLLPIGLGMSPSPQPQYAALKLVTLTCGGCHIGTVKDASQNLKYLVGGANSHFESSTLFQVFQKVVNDPNYTSDKVVAAISSKPDGYFYGTPNNPAEQAEVALIKSAAPAIMAQFKAGINAYLSAQDYFINQHMYLPNGALSYFARTPGRADAVGLVIENYVGGPQNVGMMPKTPTITKIMSVWAQNDRVVGHWASDMSSGIAPVLAGATAVAGSGAVVNRDNEAKSFDLLGGLPPPPYPFAIDMDLAAKGAPLFAANCASCHKVKDGTVYDAADVGTDPARLHALIPTTWAAFDADLHTACPTNLVSTCQPTGTSFLRSLAGPVGFVATPLDGIWARAPYLHNGSVPTLFHLLVPSSRPAQFVVGGWGYDTTNVGFDWQNNDTESEIYITGVVAQKNGGHDTPAYLGKVDWTNDAASRNALIEYMKTL